MSDAAAERPSDGLQAGPSRGLPPSLPPTHNHLVLRNMSDAAAGRSSYEPPTGPSRGLPARPSHGLRAGPSRGLPLSQPMLSHPGIQLGSSAAARLSVKDKKKKKKAPEVEVITSHRHMQRFKNILYKKLGIDEEFLHAMKTPVETTKIKTVVPDRYLRVPTLSQRNKVLMKSTGAMHSRGLRVPHFPGTIEVFPAMKAVEQAYREHLREKHDPSRLVLWTDGSPSTFAVVYRYALLGPEIWSPWKAFGFKSKGRKVMSGDMEDIAVIKAIAIAIEQARKFPGRFKSVSIYTDSQSTILSIRNKSGKPPAMYAIKKAKALKALGIEVALHWVPGHSKVPGNQLADTTATYARRYTYGDNEEWVDLSSDEEDEEVKEEPAALGVIDERGDGLRVRGTAFLTGGRATVDGLGAVLPSPYLAAKAAVGAVRQARLEEFWTKSSTEARTDSLRVPQPTEQVLDDELEEVVLEVSKAVKDTAANSRTNSHAKTQRRGAKRLKDPTGELSAYLKKEAVQLEQRRSEEVNARFKRAGAPPPEGPRHKRKIDENTIGFRIKQRHRVARSSITAPDNIAGTLKERRKAATTSITVPLFDGASGVPLNALRENSQSKTELQEGLPESTVASIATPLHAEARMGPTVGRAWGNEQAKTEPQEGLPEDAVAGIATPLHAEARMGPTVGRAWGSTAAAHTGPMEGLSENRSMTGSLAFADLAQGAPNPSLPSWIPDNRSYRGRSVSESDDEDVD